MSALKICEPLYNTSAPVDTAICCRQTVRTCLAGVIHKFSKAIRMPFRRSPLARITRYEIHARRRYTTLLQRCLTLLQEYEQYLKFVSSLHAQTDAFSTLDLHTTRPE